MKRRDSYKKLTAVLLVLGLLMNTGVILAEEEPPLSNDPELLSGENKPAEEIAEDDGDIVSFDADDPQEEYYSYSLASLVSQYPGYDSLNETDQKVYSLLNAEVQKIISGERISSVFEFNVVNEILGKNILTKDELGVENIIVPDESGNWQVTPEANQAFNNKLMTSLQKIMDALRLDHPGDYFWLHRGQGGMTGNFPGFTANLYQITIEDTAVLTISLMASPIYRLSDEEPYRFKDSAMATAKSALQKAQSVINEAASQSDYEKLLTYNNWICNNVNYDDEAIQTSGYSATDNRPWEMINVFDGDAGTKVVCEGYAKAFKYLCDNTSFANSNIRAYDATGTLNSGNTDEDHMWNLVRMDDGNMYLVDVTNNDSNDDNVEPFQQLILSGYSDLLDGQSSSVKYKALWGTVTRGDKTYSKGDVQYKMKYVYDEMSTGMYPEGIRAIEGKNYQPELPYELWVGGVRVTDDNKNDIFDDGTASAAFSEDNNTATLTLNSPDLSETVYFTQSGLNVPVTACIYSNNLNLVIKGTATMVNYDRNGAGIWVSNGNLTIDGYSDISIDTGASEGSDQTAFGIMASGNINISNSFIHIETETKHQAYGISGETVLINDSLTEADAVVPSGDNNAGIAISGRNSLIIRASDVYANGTDHGLHKEETGTITIGAGLTMKAGNCESEASTVEGFSPTASDTNYAGTLIPYFSIEDAEQLTWSYSANGNVITATCSNTSIPAQTLTLNAPDAGYDGKEYTKATVTPSASWSTKVDLPDPKNIAVVYSTAKPIDAGTYTASITVQGVTASKSFEIKKIPASLKTKPVAKTLSYTGSAQELVSSGVTEEGTLYYASGTKEKVTGEYSTSIPKETDAGTYYVWYQVKGDKNHTDSIPACITVSLSKKAAPSVTADQKPTAISGLEYTGREQALIKAPSKTVDNYTVQYSLDGSSWSTAIPKASEAKDYTVKVRYAGDKNHEDFNGEDIKVSITKVTYQVTVGSVLSWKKGSGITADYKVERSAESGTRTAYDLFSKVLMDGKEVSASNFTKEKGSLVLRLRAAYLETQANGTHTVTISFSDGNSVTSKLTILPKDSSSGDSSSNNKNNPSPKTFDRDISIYGWMLLGSMITAGYAAHLLRKQV